MAGDKQGLRVRFAKRHDVALESELWIDSHHVDQVHFSPAAGDRARAVLVDVSHGGVGIVSTMFVPRGSLLHFRALDPIDDNKPPLLEARFRVRRSRMTDRRPGYLLGGTFEDDRADFDERLMRFLTLLENVADVIDGEGRCA